MILITKTLVIFPYSQQTQQSTTKYQYEYICNSTERLSTSGGQEQEQPSQVHATSAALVIRPIRSHVNQYIADIHTRSFGGSVIHRIPASERPVKHLLSSDVDCSRFGFCSVVASICGLFSVCGMQIHDSREKQSNG